ncbi:MAG: hydroxymethylglutaryl-CoA lyase [Bacteroidia bacterium]|nr:hydroxymethylglutaryl-CoA lyase [Bacteroidia bacterium]MDW8235782.1 hydroxymethylglutaryl-CoA lyase [Bacteroidia bacterium]
MEVQIIECPRDAWQGLETFIPTEVKIQYLTALLKVGFHTIDAGSFVSPKAVPQMRDTAEVLQALPYAAYPQTGLLVIVANQRGLEQVLAQPAVRYVGYPLSLSDTFQQQNTRQTRQEAESFVSELVQRCGEAGKIPVVYLSMGFGNPYGEPYDAQEVIEVGERLRERGVPILSLADTVGVATPDLVYKVLSQVLGTISGVMWGVHLHAQPQGAKAKIEAAWEAGCRRFDSALGGYGGCPFAGVPLVSNLRTETLISFLQEKNVLPPLSQEALHEAQQLLSHAFAA